MTVVDPSLRLEHELFDAGATAVIGCDEVGRGALAGPVFVGACVVLPGTSSFPAGLRDSKMLSERRRNLLEPLVRRWTAAWALGARRPDQIDRIGIVACLAAAARDAVLGALWALPAAARDRVAVLLDGSQDWLTPVLASSHIRVHIRPKADRDCASVAGASVLAKVARDRLLIRGASVWSGYGWEHNKGYGSASHRAALAASGPTPWHRMTWLHTSGSRPGVESWENQR